MGLFYNHDPIFFYHKTSQSSTGNAFDGAVTPSGEIAHKNNRICIKIVKDPANPYKGVEDITISSVSFQKGKFYIDATAEELILAKNGKVINSGRGGVWEYRGTSPDPRSQPIQAQKMAECVAAQGRYVQKMQGISISGIDFPKH